MYCGGCIAVDLVKGLVCELNFRLGGSKTLYAAPRVLAVRMILSSLRDTSVTPVSRYGQPCKLVVCVRRWP